MASTLRIEVNGDGQSGVFNVLSFTVFDYTTTYNLTMTMTNPRNGYGTFAFYTESNVGNAQGSQARRLRDAINIDFKNIGGTNNLSAVRISNDVEITLQSGQFSNISVTGDRYQLNPLAPNNEASPLPTPVVSVSNLQAGDCTNIDYQASIVNASNTYQLQLNGTTVDAAWNGTSQTLQFTRNQLSNVKVIDILGDTIYDQNFIVPRRLNTADIEILQTAFTTGTSIEVNVTGVTGVSFGLILPEYSLNGTDYQASNTYTGLTPDTYTLYVRDIYGCVTTSTFIVQDLDAGGDTPELEVDFKYWKISEYNTLSFWEDKSFTENRYKTPYNTPSRSELGAVSHEITHYAYQDKPIRLQFKSSYPYHNIQLVDCVNRNFYPISFVEIQQNLGVIEKVDVQLRDIGKGNAAIWFNGGNQYIKDTLTVSGVSPYSKLDLADWASEPGQKVFIHNLGTFEIISTGYFEDIDAFYAVIPLPLNGDIQSQAQGIYNVQPYNLFATEFYLPLQSRFALIIERGYANNKIVGRSISEPIVRREFDEDDIFIEWSDIRNRSDMVFVSGIKPFAIFDRHRGVLLHDVASTSELAEGDSRDYSIDQDSRPFYTLNLLGLNGRMKNKISAAAATTGFKVNGLSLVKADLESETYGQTNIGELTLTLREGGNLTGIVPSETVIDIGTGNAPEIGSGKPIPIPDVLTDNKFRLVTEGKYVATEGNTIEII